MIDIHSHILYGVDDGAAGIEDSLALAKIYVQAGYRQVVATPHAHVDSLPSGTYGKTIRGLAAHLNDYFSTCSVLLEVSPGMEVGLDPLLPQMVAQGTVLTLAGTNYLLVETPFGPLPLNWQQIVFALATSGTIVILAHPERCAQVADKPELLDTMARAGVKFQLTWDSFAGTYGIRAARMARFMVCKGYVHCLATDSHDVERRNAGQVHRIMSDLKELVGEVNLKRIAIDNPARVIQNKVLLDMDIDKMPKSIRRIKQNSIKVFWTKLLRVR